VKITLTPTLCRVEGTREEHYWLRDLLCIDVPGAKYTTLYRCKRWDGKKRFYSTVTKMFPIGLLNYVLEHKNEMKIEIIDDRKFSEVSLDIPEVNLELRDYQKEAIIRCLKAKNCLVEAATNAGKTAIFASLIKMMYPLPTLIFTHREEILWQVRKEILDVSGIEIGVITARDVLLLPTTITMVATLANRLGVDQEITDFFQKTECIMVDECHHSVSKTISNLLSASTAPWRFGFSGTVPDYDSHQGMMVRQWIGDVAVRVSNEELIGKGISAKPIIHLYEIDSRERMLGVFEEAKANLPMDVSPQTLMKEVYRLSLDRGIVENTERNGKVVDVCRENKDKSILIVVDMLKHGEKVKDLLVSSGFKAEFISGSADNRKKAMSDFKKGNLRVLISTSLPYQELLPIRHNGYIKLIEIGDLCENYKNQIDRREIEVLGVEKGRKTMWHKVTATHKHRRENSVLWVKTNKKEDVYVTENHSLVNCELKKVLPQEGEEVFCPKFLKEDDGYAQEYINVAELLYDINDSSIEVEILGIGQAKIRELKSEWEYFKNPKSLSYHTRIRAQKRLQGKPDSYKKALDQLFNNFKYHKSKRRAKLFDVYKCKELFDIFDARIYIRRSRKRLSLPIKIKISKELVTLSGLMCAEGYMAKKDFLPYRSASLFVFAAMEENNIDGRRDPDKKNIRNIFCDCMCKVFGKDVPLIISDKNITCHSKLLYYLFWKLEHFSTQGEKKIPNYIFNVDKKFQEYFLWGFYLGDGSKKLNYTKAVNQNIFSGVCFHNSSRILISGICFLLQLMGKRYYIYSDAITKKKNTRVQYIITCVDPILHLVPTRFKYNKMFGEENRIQTKVIKAPREFQTDYVYDISVDRCQNFVAGCGNILCHNSIVDEGVDISRIEVLVLLAGKKSRRQLLQRVGRGLRRKEGQNKVLIVDFMDYGSRYLEKHSKARVQIYTKEKFEYHFVN
jgi:superfamily II DNA or RNA helicase